MSFESIVAQAPSSLQTVLKTTGTVTDILWSLFHEPIDVKKLSSQIVGSHLDRHVVIQGRQSGRAFAFASSQIAINAMTAPLIRFIEEEQWGIGEALKELALVQFRHVEAVWIERGDALPKPFSGEPHAVYFARRYTISIEGQPFIQIVEWFPAALY
jgi:chorismate lyase